MLRYNRDLWDVYFIDQIIVKNGVGDDVVVDIPQDWEHEKSDEEAEDDDRDKLDNEIAYARRTHPLAGGTEMIILRLF